MQPSYVTDIKPVLKSFVIWVFSDGRKGHESQTRGLLNALVKLNKSRFAVESYWVTKQTPNAHLTTYPHPDLILGAGHATHFPMLRAKILFGGVTVVLMKPSIPSIFFDMVFVPHHDSCENFGNVYATIGVLNTITRSHPNASEGTILLGGASRHFQWDTDRIAQQVKEVCDSKTDRVWNVCDSPRSPDELLSKIQDSPNIRKYPWRDTDEHFISFLLSTSSEIWVSCDSVSMLYEAVSTGVPVGVFELESRKRSNKILRGLKELATQGHIQFSHDGLTLKLRSELESQLSESTRCAELVTRYVIKNKLA